MQQAVPGTCYVATSVIHLAAAGPGPKLERVEGWLHWHCRLGLQGSAWQVRKSEAKLSCLEVLLCRLEVRVRSSVSNCRCTFEWLKSKCFGSNYCSISSYQRPCCVWGGSASYALPTIRLLQQHRQLGYEVPKTQHHADWRMFRVAARSQISSWP